MLSRLYVQRFPVTCRRTAGSIAVRSPDFSVIRAGSMALVDKTSAIADLLNHGSPDAHRVFFTRPRKFGKSLTLSIAAEMLAAGPLPEELKACWPGYKAVKIPELFGGLEVHERLLRKDATLGDLLQRPHFVVQLNLGGALSGSTLAFSITQGIARVAREAFGADLAARVAAMKSPEDAMGELITAVPPAVPIALLVDEYDGAIIQDVSRRRWECAKDGVEALRSLLMSVKSTYSHRIKRVVVTGVARFACASLFSGANNFSDLTGDPLLSRVLGFSEEEIRGTFSKELALLASKRGSSVDSAMDVLRDWYNGYCFDGKSTCYNPFPVLTALKSGCITMTELDGASDYSWLGVSPEVLIKSLGAKGLEKDREDIDIASLESQEVHAAPLLLQTGLLTLDPDTSQNDAKEGVHSGRVPLISPNKFARKTLQRVVARIAKICPRDAGEYSQHIAAALRARDHASFQGALELALSALSPRTTKDKMLSEADRQSPPPREAPYHTFLHGLLLASVTRQLGSVHSEKSTSWGDADLLLMLKDGGSGLPSAVWILEVGLGSTERELLAKVEQGKRYAQQFASEDVAVCAVLVDKKGGLVRFRWSLRPSGVISLWMPLASRLAQ